MTGGSTPAPSEHWATRQLAPPAHMWKEPEAPHCHGSKDLFGQLTGRRDVLPNLARARRNGMNDRPGLSGSGPLEGSAGDIRVGERGTDHGHPNLGPDHIQFAIERL